MKQLLPPILLFACLLLFYACQPSEPPTAKPAFYHWQTQLKLSAVEKNYLDSLAAKKLYVKFFDVDQHVPSAALIWTPADVAGIDIIPTVFITNRTLLDISDVALKELANNIASKIMTLSKGYNFAELQFDCDWTNRTQQAYFELLRLLKMEFPNTIFSSTIRLHQVKYFETTGVPPVDKGMLMCYNVGEVANWATENSILDLEVLPTYLQNFDRYPLHLDIALPLFQWGVVFRSNKLFKLINQLSIDDLQDKTRFQPINSTRFQVLQSTYLQGHYLYEGDQIRLEKVSIEDLKAAKALLEAQLTSSEFILSFYHLDERVLQQYSAKELIDL